MNDYRDDYTNRIVYQCRFCPDCLKKGVLTNVH